MKNKKRIILTVIFVYLFLVFTSLIMEELGYYDISPESQKKFDLEMKKAAEKKKVRKDGCWYGWKKGPYQTIEDCYEK